MIPTDVEPLGPDSLVWALGFERIALLLAGRALLMQVAHPVVAAGVRDHSRFRADPWGRLDRTVESLQLQLLGGQETAREAARLRDLHSKITGTGFEGRRYSALDPEAGAWVHVSNFDSVVEYYARLKHPLPGEQEERLWRDWRQVGLLLGIPDPDLPLSVPELQGWMDTMIAGRLVDSVTVRDLLDAFTLADVASPSPLLPGPVWRRLRRPGGRVLLDFTVGTLPAALRAKLGLPWTDRDERRLQRVSSVVRQVGQRLPEPLAQYPRGRQARRAAARHRAVHA